MHKKSKKEADDQAHADVVREMAKPRISKSARVAELIEILHGFRSRQARACRGPSTKSYRLQAQKAQIAIAGADNGYRDLRIENVLTDEHGEDVKLKKDAHVEVTVTAEAAQTVDEEE